MRVILIRDGLHNFYTTKNHKSLHSNCSGQKWFFSTPNSITMIVMTIIIVFFIGLCIGSFAACMIDRYNARMHWLDILVKPSHCLTCERALKPWHNIPLVSFLVQRGKCVYCGARIPTRLLMIEIGCGVGAVLVWTLIKKFS